MFRRTYRQMKKLRHASVSLFGGVLIACAFTAPSMALGPSWGPTNTPHLLTATSLRFESHVTGVGTGGVLCTDTQMPSQVQQLTRLTVTSVTFATCHGTGSVAGCTTTVQPAGLPWLATPSLSGNVRILGIRLAIQFEARPGAPGSCAAPVSVTMTGELGGGVWVGAQHQIDFSGDVGLTTHVLGLAGGWVTTVTGTLRDVTQTLTIN